MMRFMGWLGDFFKHLFLIGVCDILHIKILFLENFMDFVHSFFGFIKRYISYFIVLPFILNFISILLIIYGDFETLGNYIDHQDIPKPFIFTNVSDNVKEKSIIVGAFTYYITAIFCFYYFIVFWALRIYTLYFDDDAKDYRKKLRSLMFSRTVNDFIQSDDFVATNETKSYLEKTNINFSLEKSALFGTIFCILILIFSNKFRIDSNIDLFKYSVSVNFLITFMPICISLILLPTIAKYTSWLKD